MGQNRFFYLLVAGIFLLVVSLPLFYNLGEQPIRIWDEARLALNAWEMNKNGNVLVTHFEGAPDMWNVKPPLMIWLQVVFIKMIGFNELAIRLPSAIAALLTCICMAWFSKRYFDKYRYGVVAILILVTSNGYIDTHAARTGDYDALLTLLTSLYTFAIFLYLEKQSTRYLHLFFAALGLAVLTKSIQGLLFLPAIAIYITIEKKWRLLTSNRWFYFDFLFLVATIATYYLLHETLARGYLKAVWNNEIGGRYFSTLENNRFGFTYYFEKLKDYSYNFWYWMVPFGFASGYFSKNRPLGTFTKYIGITALVYLLIISFSQTKLLWYAVPVLPPLAFLTSIFLLRIMEFLLSIKMNAHIKKFIPVAFFMIIFLFPYYKMAAKVYRSEEYEWDKEIYPVARLLQGAFRHQYSLDGHVIAFEGFNNHLLFYVRALHNKGQHLTFKSKENLQPGEYVIASEPPVTTYIENIYFVEIKRADQNCRLYRIIARK